MPFRKTDMVGRYGWRAKTSKKDSFSRMNTDDCWQDKDATLEELQKSLAESTPDEEYLFFFCTTWKRIGRKIGEYYYRVIDLEGGKLYQRDEETWELLVTDLDGSPVETAHADKEGG